MLVTKQKTGFYSTDPYVMIYKGAKPFYYKTRNNTNNGVIELNMPPGEFYVLSGKLKQLDEPIDYELISKYKKDYPSADIPEFDVSVGDNPHKCTIDLFAKPKPTVLLDRSLADCTEPELLYVFGHEYYHNINRGHGQDSERACDIGSCISNLIYGLNPCQLVGAIDMVLSNNVLSCVRKNDIYYEMKKLN